MFVKCKTVMQGLWLISVFIILDSVVHLHVLWWFSVCIDNMQLSPQQCT